jgi:NAD(P)-dependent dehydrogenase (short-subunit alcohol dehydrogenase family)
VSVETPPEVTDAFSRVGTLLAGRVVLVMGASRGIGAGIATGLARAGAMLALASRDLAATEQVAASIAAFADKPMVLPVDVSDAASVRACVEAVVARHGRVDGAVNNAGRSHPAAPLHEIPDDTYDAVMDTDVRGMFLCMKAEIAQMMKQGRGAIVNLASTGSFVANPGLSLYMAAKHADVGLTRTAATDYAQKGIRINAIAPGVTATEMVMRGTGRTEEGRTRLVSRAPMRRMAAPEEMAGPVIWLLSDLASYVTGAIVPVDGGWLAN